MTSKHLKSGPQSARQRNVNHTAFRWRADDGPTLYADWVYIEWTKIRVSRDLGPNKDGLVTYIQVNVYIGNMLSWLNGG